MLAPDIIEISFSERVMLDLSISDQIERKIQELAPNRKVYQVVMAHGPYVVDPEMRNAVQHGEAGLKQLAIAWVSPDEKANREQEEILSKLPLPVPIRFFSRQEDALAWFKSLSGS